MSRRNRFGVFSLILLQGFFFPFAGLAAQEQDAPSISKDVSPPMVNAGKPQQEAGNAASEVATRDTPAAFKINVNLVQVRVVVRDAQGKVVENLQKGDFELFDGRKLQKVSTFGVETPASRRIKIAAATSADGSAANNETGPAGESMNLPQRFVAMVFDDSHMTLEDSQTVRDAATKFLRTLALGDRAGIYTTSGQFTQEFTSDTEALKRALFGVVPRGTTEQSSSDCPPVTYYQADRSGKSAWCGG